jgi:MFS family permease
MRRKITNLSFTWNWNRFRRNNRNYDLDKLDIILSDLSLSWISRDGKLLLTARILRAFAYGFLSIVLAIYLKLLGFDDILIGLLLSFTLINSVIFTLIASFYADKLGRRRTLIIYATLMSISGAVFVFTENYVAMVLAALIGTVNITGSETGAFLSIEQAILPQTVRDSQKKNTIFGLYNMVGTFAMSAGILVSGVPNLLQLYGLSQINSIKPLFAMYLIIGIAVTAIYFMLSEEIEIKKKKTVQNSFSRTLSPKSKNIVARLSGLFAIDSFAGGFVIQSIVSLWFFTKFDVNLTTLSYIFSVAGVLTAFSFIVATKLADRIGLINTMVFTHIPSNILLILVGFAPTLPMAIGFYLARMALSQMDVPARQSYVVTVVNEDERTAAAGITNVSRNIAQAISPSLTGYILYSLPSLAAPFVLGGVLKIIYDISLYLNFKNIKPKIDK